jgi:Zn-dependent peptidase ImmA (M78 family)/transcriptional regulator with XRE-family HTH domain
MFSERLKLARKRAGLSLRDLADSTGVSHQAIKKYEDGDMYPNSQVLVSLSRTLSVSIDFLMSNQVEELVGVEFRKHSGTTRKDRARVEAAVIEEVEHYLEVESVLGIDEAKIDLGGLSAEGPITSLEEAEQRALRLRDHWKLGHDPILSITALLEEQGFKVAEVDLPDKVVGLTCEVKREGDKPPFSVIVVAKNNPNVERRRFTLAHELAHKLIPEVAEGVNKERAMHRFAGALLVDSDHLKRDVGGKRHAFAYREIIKLKHLYGVSASSLLLRLRDLGLLSEDAVNVAFRTYAKTWRKSEPEPLALNGPYFETPMRFEQLVYRALAEQMLSLPRAAELLNRSVQDVEKEVRGSAASNADHHP